MLRNKIFLQILFIFILGGFADSEFTFAEKLSNPFERLSKISESTKLQTGFSKQIILKILHRINALLGSTESHAFLDLLCSNMDQNFKYAYFNYLLATIDSYNYNIEFAIPPSLMIELYSPHFASTEIGKLTIKYLHQKFSSITNTNTKHVSVTLSDNQLERINEHIAQAKQFIKKSIIADIIYAIIEKHSKGQTFLYRYLKERNAYRTTQQEKEEIIDYNMLQKYPKLLKNFPEAFAVLKRIKNTNHRDFNSNIYQAMIYLFWLTEQPSFINQPNQSHTLLHRYIIEFTENLLHAGTHNIQSPLALIYNIEIASKHDGYLKTNHTINPLTNLPIANEFQNYLSELPLEAAAFEFEFSSEQNAIGILVSLLQSVSFSLAQRFGTKNNSFYSTDHMLNIHKIQTDFLENLFYSYFEHHPQFRLKLLHGLLKEVFAIRAANCIDWLSARSRILIDLNSINFEEYSKQGYPYIETTLGEIFKNGKKIRAARKYDFQPPILGKMTKLQALLSTSLLGRYPYAPMISTASLNYTVNNKIATIGTVPIILPLGSENTSNNSEAGLDEKIIQYLSMQEISQDSLQTITIQDRSYYIEKNPFAQGEQAKAYRAWSADTRKPVVIKQAIGNKGIFTNIMQTQGGVEFSSIVRPLAVSNDGSKVVLEYVNGMGMTLEWVLNRLRNKLNAMYPNHVFEIGLWLVETLQKAAENGIHHSDLKPDQILIGYDINTKTIQKKLTDFSAKIIETELDAPADSDQESKSRPLQSSVVRSVVRTSSAVINLPQDEKIALNPKYSHPQAPFEPPSERLDAHAAAKIVYAFWTSGQHEPQSFLSDAHAYGDLISDTYGINRNSSLGKSVFDFFLGALSGDVKREHSNLASLHYKLSSLRRAYMSWVGPPNETTELVLKKLLLAYLEETYGNRRIDAIKKIELLNEDLTSAPFNKEKTDAIEQAITKNHDNSLEAWIQSQMEQFLDSEKLKKEEWQLIFDELKSEVSVLDWDKDRMLIQDTILAALTDYKDIYKPLSAETAALIKKLSQMQTSRKSVLNPTRKECAKILESPQTAQAPTLRTRTEVLE